MKYCSECVHPFPYADTEMKCPKCGKELKMVPVKEDPKKKGKTSRPSSSGGISLDLLHNKWIVGGMALVLVGSLGMVGLHHLFTKNQVEVPVATSVVNSQNTSVTYQTIDPSTVEMNQRYFTSRFSFIVDTTPFGEGSFLVYPDASPMASDYSKFQEELTALVQADMDDVEMGLEAYENLSFHSEAESYQTLLMAGNIYGVFAYGLTQAYFDSVADFMNKNMTVSPTGFFDVGGTSVQHDRITLQVQLGGMEEDAYGTVEALEELGFGTAQVTEIFRVPYPEKEGSFFEVIISGLRQGLTEGEVHTFLSTLLESFITNEKLMEYNESGEAKIKTHTFTADYNPDYFKDARIPYLLSSNPYSFLGYETIPLQYGDLSLNLEVKQYFGDTLVSYDGLPKQEWEGLLFGLQQEEVNVEKAEGGARDIASDNRDCVSIACIP